ACFFTSEILGGKFSAGAVIASLSERIDGRGRATLGRWATRSPASKQRVAAAARSTRFFTTNSPSMVRMGKLGRKAVCGEDNTTLKVTIRCSTAEAAVHLLHTPASNISPMVSSEWASALEKGGVASRGEVSRIGASHGPRMARLGSREQR